MGYSSKRILGPNERFARWSTSADFDKYRYDKHNKKQQQRYLKYVKNKIESVPYAVDVLRLIPAEPVLKVITKSHLSKKLNQAEHQQVRLTLINANIVNWKSMVQIDSNDNSKKIVTPFFLNTLGKFFYQEYFNHSPDSLSKEFYQHRVIHNRDFSIRHIDFIHDYYQKMGHYVICGFYPFDVLIDNKHGFMLFEQHENSVGMEKRLSVALYYARYENIILYIPAMTPELQRRVNALIAGLLFYEFDGEHYPFSYITYLESGICNDKAGGWSYICTSPRNHYQAEPPKNPLPFPKISGLYSKHMVNSTMKNLKDNSEFQNKVSYTFDTIYINNLKDTKIESGIRVTVAVGQMLDVWEEMANDSDVIVTSLCSKSMLQSIHKYPALLIVDGHRRGSEHSDSLDEFRKRGTVIESNRNHAKAILNGYKLLVHSMPTSRFMGNNRESYAIIDFSEHPKKDKIYKRLFNLLYNFGMGSEKEFMNDLNILRQLFNYRIEIYSHFKNRTKDWAYYKRINYLSSIYRSKDPITIYTSHISLKPLSKRCKSIYIQGTSRDKNHEAYIAAVKRGCPILKRRMWHPRIAYNNFFIAVGSWDFSLINVQKELQLIIHLQFSKNDKY